MMIKWKNNIKVVINIIKSIIIFLGNVVNQSKVPHLKAKLGNYMEKEPSTNKK